MKLKCQFMWFRKLNEETRRCGIRHRFLIKNLIVDTIAFILPVLLPIAIQRFAGLLRESVEQTTFAEFMQRDFAYGVLGFSLLSILLSIFNLSDLVQSLIGWLKFFYKAMLIINIPICFALFGVLLFYHISETPQITTQFDTIFRIVEWVGLFSAMYLYLFQNSDQIIMKKGESKTC